jgi:hypothetical protein
MLSEWPRIQQALRRHRPEIGYITLSLYGGNGGATETVGRLDFADRNLRHWLEHGVADDAEDGLQDVLAALGRSVPSSDTEDAYAVTPSATKRHADSADDEDADDDEEEEEDDDDEEEEEEASPPPLSNSQVEAAVRRWLTTTCEQNCLDAGEASFRVRVYAHSGVKQLWSTLLRYQSTSAPPRPPTAAAAPLPRAQHTAPTPTSPHLLLRRSSPMNQPPGDGHSNGYPSSLIRQPTAQVPQRPERKVQEYAESFMQDVAGTGLRKAEVDTLHAIHGMVRTFAASVLNTSKEQQQVYQRIIGELAGSLSDARQHNNDLLAENSQIQRARMEQERELLETTDKGRVRESLGREGLQQAGSLIRTVIQSQAAQAQRARVEEAPAQTEGPSQYPEVDEEGNVITSEPTEEQLAALSQWLHERPDVVETLLDGSVQNYLKTPENVEQLRGLATMMAGEPAETEKTDNG